MVAVVVTTTEFMYVDTQTSGIFRCGTSNPRGLGSKEMVL
jgi:hypothetical protein